VRYYWVSLDELPLNGFRSNFAGIFQVLVGDRVIAGGKGNPSSGDQTSRGWKKK
jgi:hypothetical protein